MESNQERLASGLHEFSILPDRAAEIAAWIANVKPPILMPDLPEPEIKDGRKVWRVDEEGFVYIKPNGLIATVAVGNPYNSPSIAYRHALATIAAASHTEQEQDNE